MADGATPGAPAAPPSKPGSNGGAVPEPQGTNGTVPPAPKRYKFDLGDGEREWDETSIRDLAVRGRKAAQTLSLAEKRAQEAAKREEEAKSFRSRFETKDPKQIRAALKELGVDERMLANDVGRELLEEMDLTPEQKKVRELERQLREREAEAEKGKKTEAEKRLAEDTERHKAELSDLFMEVVQKANLPRESALHVFPRIARLYEAVESSGGKVDTDLAAERVKAGLHAEHRAMYYKPDGKGGQVLDVGAVVAMLGPEALDEIRRHAVQEYRTKVRGGNVAPPPQSRQPTEPEQPQKRPGNFWKDLDRRLK